MSTRIRINPAQLRELAQEMRAANNRNMDSIRSKISERESVNEHLAGSKERRHRRLLDSMFLRVDNAGLSTLLTSFTDSYNRVESTRRPLDQIVNNETPPPSQVFESNNDTRWFVGGSRWGNIGRTSQQALNNEYQAVRSMVESLRDSFGTHQSTLEGFARGGATHWYHTSSNGFASNAFISRLNYVSDDALEVFVGIGGRSGQSDGMVVTAREVLDVLLRNIDTTDAKGEELATQAESLASSRETTDRQARSLFEDGGLTVMDSQITRSQVELVIYLSDLLSDGKGLETAREQQHEERFNTLKTNLTSNLIEVAEFIAPSWSNIISLSCEDAITAINHWENFINQSVEVQMREAHTEQRMVRTGMTSFETQDVTVMRWGERQPRGTLRDFLGDVVTTVEALKGVLSEWQSAFTTTENRARNFVDAINSDAHISGLDEQVERAIYPSSPPFQDLQRFATDAKNGLEHQASVYSRIANIIMSNMDGAASRSYVGALHRGATYFRAIAQTIEKNFWSGDFSGEVNRVSSFTTRPHTTSAWSRKPLSELLTELGICPDTGALTQPITEEVWNNIEYILGLQIHSITDEMWGGLAVLFTQLDASAGVEPNDMTRFIQLLAAEVELTGINSRPRRTEWVLCQDRMARLEQSIHAMGTIAMAQSMYIRGLRGEELDRFIESICPEELQRIRAMSVHSNPTNAELRDLIADQFDEQQREYLGRSSVLSTLMTLENFRWASPPGQVSMRIHGNITGSSGASEPMLNIVVDEHGYYTLTFNKIMTQTMGHGSRDSIVEQTFRISPGLTSDRVSAYGIHDVENFHSDMFTFDPLSHLQREQFNLMIGLLPLPGVASTAAGLIIPVLDIPLGFDQAESDLEAARAVTSNTIAGHLATQLNLIGVVVDDGRGAPNTMILRPTATTQALLDDLNAQHGTTFTLDQVFESPREVFLEFWPDRLSGGR